MDKKQRAMAFLAGILIAIGAGLFTFDPMIKILLIVLGLIVGIVNVTEKESLLVMVSVIAIALGGTALSLIPGIGSMITNILQSIAVFAWPVAIVTGIKTFYSKAKN